MNEGRDSGVFYLPVDAEARKRRKRKGKSSMRRVVSLLPVTVILIGSVACFNK